MNEDVLEEIERIGIDDINKELYDYTAVKLKQYYWKSGKSSGPKGELAKDFVHEAMMRALSRWNWDQSKHPEIMPWLKSRVDSLISNSITSAANKTASSKDIHDPENHTIMSSNIPMPDQEIAGEELYEHMRKSVLSLKKGKDDMICEVFEAICAGYEPEEIAELIDVERAEIYNYNKRISRAVSKFKPKTS